MLVSQPAWADSDNPCDHYLPTGQPLPRQDTLRLNATVHDDPTWRGHRVGIAHAGDQVEVLKECGRALEIRTPDGIEGWVATFFLPHEEMLAREAYDRPISSIEDCRLRYDIPQLAQECAATFTRRKAREDELAHSTPIVGDQLRDFVSGNTVMLTGRPDQNGDPSQQPPVRLFFAKNGEVFTVLGDDPATANLWRGRWLVNGDQLCMPGTNAGCSTARRIPGGKTVFGAPNTGEFFAAVERGDSKGTVQEVRAAFPYAAPPPVPDGLRDIAHPYMGW